MSTRSDIITKLSTGKWAGKWGRIYCHFDGHPEHVGKILMEHYTDQAKIEQLIGLGHISSLGQDTGEKHDFERVPFGRSPGYDTMAYGRDHGKSDTSAYIQDSLEEVWPPADTWTEFTYVWKDNEWWVAYPRSGALSLVKVADALEARKLEEGS
jgi:hypothetical protein